MSKEPNETTNQGNYESRKLRIKGNSLRLRVSRFELAPFQLGGRIEETIRFTEASDAKLTYALESAA
jgi:hypothetical protein